jgi:hypothetical protein
MDIEVLKQANHLRYEIEKAQNHLDYYKSVGNYRLSIQSGNRSIEIPNECRAKILIVLIDHYTDIIEKMSVEFNNL